MTAETNIHVLVVEDDVSMRRLTERFLTGLGYHVHTADSADAAFAVLRNEEIHVVVSDHHLGGMDGVSLLELCKRSFPTLPRILVTAATEFAVAARAMNEGGVSALVRKPWSGPELGDAVSSVVRVPMDKRSNTIPQFTAVLPRTSEAPIVSWDEVDEAESQRLVDSQRDLEALARLFDGALSQ